MPIVLAIEPDRRQAAHLAAIVRHQVGAELLIADTTEGALDAIGNRVPDLVLVPALLSPQDDAALAAALRVIAAAAHVRTLTIPVLTSGIAHAPKLGMLAKWRKGRDASPEPDGCDPAVFAEQISTYLQEAAAARAQIDEDLLLGDQTAVHVEPPAEPFEQRWTAPIEQAWAAPVEQAWTAPVEQARTAPVEQAWAAPIERAWAAPVEQAWSAPVEQAWSAQVEQARTAPVEAWQPDPEPVQPWSAARVQETPVDPEETSIELEEPSIDLSEELEGLSEDGDVDQGGELFDGERVGVYMISADADEVELETFDLLPAILEPPAIAGPVVEATAAASEDVAIREFATLTERARPLSIAKVAPEPVSAEPEPPFVEPIEPPRADIKPWIPMYLTPGRMWPALEGMPAEMPVARTEQPDWIELVASLRQDLERRRTEPASAAADPIAARPSDGAKAVAHPLVKRPRVQVKKAKPVQDEWGFFDPEQCGFSTLLAKLEEITEEG
jgi:hypothetical protein